MPLLKPPTKPHSKLPINQPLQAARRASSKADNELAIKGILCALIGLGVLLSPYAITSPGMQGIVGKSALVGWFALVLGLAFLGLYARRRWGQRTK